jgi:hypothetical protein
MCNTTFNLDDAAPVRDEPVIIERADYSSTIEDEDDDDDDDDDESVKEKDEDEESVEVEGMGKLVKDLFRSDFVKVSAALDALLVDLRKDKEHCETFTFWGGGIALVQLVKNCLKKAMKKIPACDQVTELNELAELETLDKSLHLIICLTYMHDVSRVGITTVGGVEAVVEVMKTFPKCEALQSIACRAINNLTACNIGTQKAAEMGGMNVLLAAVNNHLSSANVCQHAILAMRRILVGSKENAELLISLGGVTDVAKVKNKWPDNDKVQPQVRHLAKLIAAEINSWAVEE